MEIVAFDIQMLSFLVNNWFRPSPQTGPDAVDRKKKKISIIFPVMLQVYDRSQEWTDENRSCPSTCSPNALEDAKEVRKICLKITFEIIRSSALHTAKSSWNVSASWDALCVLYKFRLWSRFFWRPELLYVTNQQRGNLFKWENSLLSC